MRLLDANNRPLDGFSLQDCIAVEADGVRQVVSWKSTTKIRPDRQLRYMRWFSLSITD